MTLGEPCPQPFRRLRNGAGACDPHDVEAKGLGPVDEGALQRPGV